jgi:3-hydroxyisobutyrate dehydrogenase
VGEIERMNVAFIGLGAMGRGMSKRLIEAGHAVVGHDIVPAARDALAKAGGRAAADAAAACRGAEALIVMVFNAEQVEAVLFGPSGAAETLPKGAVVIMSVTMTPAQSKAFADRLAAKGWPMLDAPMSGGAAAAEQGQLSFMAAGSDEAFAKAEPLLAPMAKRVYRLGAECGMGSTMKMVHQIAAGANLAVAAELTAFGARMGLDPGLIFEIVNNAAGQSRMYEIVGPRMLDRDFAPKGPLEIFVKDLGIALEAAKANRFPLPMASAAHQLYLAAAAHGHITEDVAAVIKVYEALSGVTVRRGR